MERIRHYKGWKLMALCIAVALFISVALTSSAHAVNIQNIGFITSDDTLQNTDYATNEQAKSTTLPKIYLSEEDLVVTSDLPEYEVVDVSLICLDNKNTPPVALDIYRFLNNTYVSSYDLKTYACSDFLIQIEYLIEGEAHRLTREVKTEKLSKVLQHVVESQEIDGGFRDAESTAYAVLAMSGYKSYFNTELSRSMDWLKENRNNQYKCWPKESCTIKTTSQILALLTAAGYNESSRIVWDGNRWLMSMQNTFSKDTIWNINITAAADAGCVLTYMKDTFATVNGTNETNTTTTNTTTTNTTASNSTNATSRLFPKMSDAQSFLDNAAVTTDVIDHDNFYLTNKQSTDYFIIPENNQRITLRCSDNVELTLYNFENETIYTTSGKDISFKIEDNCWSLFEKWGECDTETTLYAMLTSINETRKAGAEEWLRSKLKENKITGEYIGENQPYRYSTVVESALYLEYFTNDSNVKDWLYFTQNNDGSWGKDKGKSERIIDTAYALWALQSIEQDSEVIRDGRRWLSLNEPAEGWDTVEKNALAYKILYNNVKPFLKAKPNIIILDDKEGSIKISNPTFFNIENVEMTLENGADQYMSFEPITEMPPFSTKTLHLTRKEVEAGRYYGYLLFSTKPITNLSANVSINTSDTSLNTTNATVNISDESPGKLLRIPVIVIRYPEISLSVKNNPAYIFGESGTIDFDVSKTAGEFTCSVEWNESDFLSDRDFTINQQKTVSVRIQYRERMKRTTTYEGQWVCVNPDKTYVIPFSVEVRQYPSIPLEFEEQEISVTNPDQRPSLTVHNLLDEPLEVSFSFEKAEQYFEFGQQPIQIESSGTVTVPLVSHMPKLTKNNLAMKVESQNAIVASTFGGNWKGNVPFTIDIADYAEMYKRKMLINYGIAMGIILFVLSGISFAFRKQLMVETFLISRRIRLRLGFIGDTLRYYAKLVPLKIIALIPKKIAEKIPGIKNAYTTKPKKAEKAKEAFRSADLIETEEGKSFRMADREMTKTPVADSHVLDLVRIMKSLHKADDQIKAQLAQEGFSAGEIDFALAEIASLEKEKLKKTTEEKIFQVINTLEESEDAVKGALKGKGIEDKYVHMALSKMEQISEDEAKREGIDIKKFRHEEKK